MASLSAAHSRRQLVQGDDTALVKDLTRVLSDLQERLDGESSDQPTADGGPAEVEGIQLTTLTESDLDTQKRIFDQFDTDNTGQLAQGETVRMMKAMELFSTEDELVATIKEMDDDNSGTIDYAEYVSYIDAKCNADPEFYTSYRTKSHTTKLGYDGTTWRKAANIAWMTNQGIMILTMLAILTALIYFKFILVPMTMAYFLTFLLGPVQDVLIQRPLICCGAVCCDKPGIRPALGKSVGILGKEKGEWWMDEAQTQARYQTPAERWKDVVKDTGEWDGVNQRMRWAKEGQEGCCYAIPPPKWSDEPAQGGSPLKRVIYDLFAVGKIPESLSVLVTFILTGTLLFLVVIVISAEIVDVVEDPAFQDAKKNATRELNGYLKEEYKFSVTELLELNETVDDDVQTYDQEDLGALAAPWLVVINDLVTTLLLCLYMLSTRVPENEEQTYKEIQRMNLFEKIKDKIKHYVILKTALSALTGGVVGFILFACSVRLAILFGILTFMLNFIPTVGSLVAMILPIPLIVLDEVENDWTGRKALAILLPVAIQGYVGNILEPSVFGKSLNVTAISVLVALVLWGSIWGLQGAVLSVPLLAAMKVALEEADHPMAKMVLRVVRESASIDDAVEAQKGRKERKTQKMAEREAIKTNTPRKHSQWNLNADEDGEDFRMSSQKGFENPILEEDEADLESQE